MSEKDSGSYDSKEEHVSVSIAGAKIDSKTAQQLSSSGAASRVKREENKLSKALNEFAGDIIKDAEASKKDEAKGDSSK
jgi:hypothetical protein